ncbi:tetratricopeptide repeat protein [Agaribacterium sp. ZY112]|uniref:tetratricopeptide repeat protein n=1 Tax=Agaribacterium sp. ZY112 TaxID=3233574 RepID=UPI0035261AC0
MLFCKRPKHCVLAAFFTVSAALGLSACSSTPAKQAATPLPKVEIEPSLHFQQDSLYRLLTAELALVRERYDVGLDNYVEEAIESRDVNVTARATQIARILKNHSETLMLAEQWRELDPGSYEARFILISEYIYAERFEEAFAESQRLLAAGHSSGFEDIAIDAAQKNYSKNDELTQAYSNLLKQYPKNTELLVGYSILLQTKGELEPALKAIKKANKLDKNNSRARFQEFRVLTAMQRTDEAITAYGKMVELQPQNPQLRNRYAQLLIGYDLGMALEQYQILHEQTPQDADVLLNLALLEYSQGNIPAAKNTFNNLLSRNQYTGIAHFNLGDMAEREGRKNDAINHYIQVKSGTRYVEASSRAAELIARNETFSNALAFLSARREQADTPGHKESLYQVEAETLSSTQQDARAISVYRQGLNEFPESVILHYSRAMYYAARRNPDKAEQDFLIVLMQSPNNAATLNALGYTLLDQTNRLADAAVYIERAYALKPNDAAIIDSMGWLAFKQGNYKQAQELLEQAYKQTKDHEIAAHLGEVLWQQGDQRRARKIWKEAINNWPNSETLKQTLKRLEVEL